jgi:hypothetical protein
VIQEILLSEEKREVGHPGVVGGGGGVEGHGDAVPDVDVADDSGMVREEARVDDMVSLRPDCPVLEGRTVRCWRARTVRCWRARRLRWWRRRGRGRGERGGQGRRRRGGGGS